MNASLAQAVALDDFLAWERRQELRYEFDGTHQPVAMTGASRVRYPDAVITCAAVPDDTDVVPEPLIVFEVLSSSTALVDRNVKAAEYYATPSIERYVMVELTKAEVTVLERAATGWRQSMLTGLAAVLALPEVAVALPLSEVYRRVQLAG
jgi:Uma2 family endonuclease